MGKLIAWVLPFCPVRCLEEACGLWKLSVGSESLPGSGGQGGEDVRRDAAKGGGTLQSGAAISFLPRQKQK